MSGCLCHSLPESLTCMRKPTERAWTGSAEGCSCPAAHSCRTSRACCRAMPGTYSGAATEWRSWSQRQSRGRGNVSADGRRLRPVLLQLLIHPSAGTQARAQPVRAHHQHQLEAAGC